MTCHAALAEALTLLFTAPLAGLGDPAWPARERATAVMTTLWPLSEPALAAAARSADPEVRLRGRDAREAALRRRLGPALRHDLRLLAGGAARDWDELRAFVAVAGRYDDSPAPWVPVRHPAFRGFAEDMKLRAAVTRVVLRLGLLWGNHILACDPACRATDAECVGGLNVARLHYRLLPVPGVDRHPNGRPYTAAELDRLAGILYPAGR
jgi:hypothetical protein